MNSSVYDTRNDRIRRERTGSYKYPVIHAIHKDKSKVILFTNEKHKQGGIGVPKLIFNGYGGWNEPVLDLNGKYGMSEVVFGLPIHSKEQGIQLFNFFKNEKILERFQNDMKWSTSRPLIFWNMFNHIKKNFYIKK